MSSSAKHLHSKRKHVGVEEKAQSSDADTPESSKMTCSEILDEGDLETQEFLAKRLSEALDR
jgi:hypothetical protein